MIYPFLVFTMLLLSSHVFALSHQSLRRLSTRNHITILKGSLKPQITKLIGGTDLTSEETEAAWDEILKGSDPAPVGALLVLLRSKGETPSEIAGMVRSMKKACSPVNVVGKLLDIVGTGGDGADTINISTASVVLAAACGCKVAKAGNRSVSSRCGSADVLETLGVKIELQPSQVEQSIEECGIGFMYAPINHPAMKTVAPIRKSLGVRTAFNILGPMTNAANAQRAVIGVFDESLIDLLANSLMEVGHLDHGVVLSGCGLDEISPLGPSTVFEIKNVAKEGEPKVYETKRWAKSSFLRHVYKAGTCIFFHAYVNICTCYYGRQLQYPLIFLKLVALCETRQVLPGPP